MGKTSIPSRAAEVDYQRPLSLRQAHRKPVGSVVSALRIMEHLSSVQWPLRVTHIAQDLGLNQSTCFEILNTLVCEGYLQFSPRMKGYSIGPRVVVLGRSVLDPKGAFEAVRPAMRHIAETHDLIVTIWKRSALDRMTLIACAESGAAVRLHLTVGHSVPLLLGAIGRVMASRVELSLSDLEQQFRQVRWGAPISFETFMAEARAAREAGFAIDHCIANKALITIARPISSDTGYTDWVCCASLFAGSYPAALFETIATELSGICRDVARIAY